MGLMIMILMKLKTNALSARTQLNYLTLEVVESGAPVEWALAGGIVLHVTFYSKSKGLMYLKIFVIVL